MADTLNVSFLRGTQAKLNGLTTFQPGAFYLTSDTDRLYFAQAANELVYLNRYISTVDLAQKDTLQPSKTYLPALADVSVGDFYYVAEGNILCTKATEGATQWTQINPPDTNTDVSVSGLSFASVADSGNIKVTYTLTQQNKNVITGSNIGEATEITGNFLIKGSDIGAVVSNIALDTKATVANNVATIELEGTGVAGDADGFTIAAGNNVSITSDATNDVIISAVDTTYDIGSAANSTDIVLKNVLTGSETDKVAIVAGTDNDSIAVTGVNKDEIVVSHKGYTYAGTTLADQNATFGGSVDIISGLTVDNGHVTDISTSKINLPKANYQEVSAVSADANGKLHITVKDEKGTETVIDSLQDLYYTVDAEGTKVYNQGNLNNYFYTKSEIDNTLKAANAMTFIGSVGVGGKVETLPTDDVKAGDTYIVVGDTTVNSVGNKGDLFVASGVEGSDGTLLAIDWIHIPAGDDIDTTYKFAMNAGSGLVVKDHNDNLQIAVAFKGDKDVENAKADAAINVVTSGADKSGQVLISHANVTRQDPAKSSVDVSPGATVAVVTEVTTNDKGHVTAVRTSDLKMPQEVTYHIDGKTANKALLVDQNGDTDGTITINGGTKVNVTSTGDEKSATFTVEHNTMEVEAGTASANLDAKGTFTAITGIKDDGYGHVSKVTTTTYTLPKDTTYTLSGASVNLATVDGVNTVTVVDTLTNDAGTASGTSTFALASKSLAMNVTGTTITAELTWGSF